MDNQAQQRQSDTEQLMAEEAQYGREMLRSGLGAVINRGRQCAGLPAVAIEETGGVVDSWYETILGAIPCQHWRDVGMFASRYTKPVDKFTLGQFFEAWERYREQGRARGFENWR